MGDQYSKIRRWILWISGRHRWGYHIWTVPRFGPQTPQQTFSVNDSFAKNPFQIPRLFNPSPVYAKKKKKEREKKLSNPQAILRPSYTNKNSKWPKLPNLIIVSVNLNLNQTSCDVVPGALSCYPHGQRPDYTPDTWRSDVPHAVLWYGASMMHGC